MTTSEAIVILRDMGGCCSSDNEYIACDMAISALEKQEGEKPQITSFADKSYDYSCPKCWRPFISSINGKWCWGHKLDFCDQCGQKILWE